MAKGVEPGLALLIIALAHGVGLSLAVSNFGGISGAHVNPAITCGFLVTGRIAPGLAVAYIVAQLLGATTAAGICRVIFPADVVSATTLGLPLPAPWASTSVVLFTEFVLTYLLATSVFGTAVDERGRNVKVAGFGIGLGGCRNEGRFVLAADIAALDVQRPIRIDADEGAGVRDGGRVENMRPVVQGCEGLLEFAKARVYLIGHLVGILVLLL